MYTNGEIGETIEKLTVLLQKFFENQTSYTYTFTYFITKSQLFKTHLKRVKRGLLRWNLR